MKHLANYCCFTDTDNVGDYSLYQANKILFKDNISPNSDGLPSDINLFGGGTLYPYCLRYGSYEKRKIEVAIGLGVIDPDEAGKFGFITQYMMKKRKFDYFGVRGIHSHRILKEHNIHSTITGDTALVHRCDSNVTVDSDLIGINFVGEKMSRLGEQGLITKK